jgi:hypothetical protein
VVRAGLASQESGSMVSVSQAYFSLYSLFLLFLLAQVTLRPMPCRPPY